MNLIKNFLGSHRRAIIIVLTPVVLFVLASFIVAAKITLDQRREQREFDRKTKEFQAALEKPYREDVYGGKTPEQTWGLFLDALRKGDIDLASKYFVVDKREEYKKILKRSKKDNELNSWIKEMEKLRKSNKESLENQSNYYYDYFDKEYNQSLSNSVVFYLNPHTKVWKILVL